MAGLAITSGFLKFELSDRVTTAHSARTYHSPSTSFLLFTASEVILVAVVTLLGLLFLVILIVRWSRCRKNVTQISRVNSEQCAGLLDNEDGIASARRNKAPSTTSLGRPSVNPVGAQSTSSMGLSRSNPDKTRSNKAVGDPMSGNAGHITGTIGPIMQFSAPIPGATGPINLCQKTFVQTPGPFVQLAEQEDPSELCSAAGSNYAVNSQAMGGPPPCAISGRSSSVPNCPSATPIIISQRTTTRPGPPVILRQDPALGCPRLHEIQRVLPLLTKWSETGKHKLELVTPVIFVFAPIGSGQICGGITRKSDSKAHMVKYGGGVPCPDFNKESLRKKMLVGSNDSFTALHKREMKRRVRSIEGARGRSWRGGRGCCDPDISRDNYLCEGEAHVVDQVGITRRPESLICCEAEIPRAQESQVRFDTGMENECAPQVVWCEPPAPRRWECVNRKNEEGILRKQDSRMRAEDGPPVTWQPQHTRNVSPRRAEGGPPVTRHPEYTNNAAPPPAARPPRREAPAETPTAWPPQGEAPAGTPTAWPPQGEAPAETPTAPSEASLGQQGEYPM
uniref:testis-expressed basic protein 1 isoform X5 n=1 Tax=Myodes glareolus TaxID=447135 RepID=UPI00202191F3|nr:testis-expressed basic protein 1 isoform X5 [Myodes glareolus]